MDITGCTTLPMLFLTLKNEDNWTWFMKNLRRAVGSPDGLVICTDACKGLENAVGAVFLEAEYR